MRLALKPILPLDTLRTEMPARLKPGMIDVMSGFIGERSTDNMESLPRDLIDAVRANNGETETVPAVNAEKMVMANDMDARPLAGQISGMTIYNPGTVPAFPTFNLCGSGTIPLITYSGAAVLSGIGNGIVLDWEAQECMGLDGGTLLNDKADGDPRYLLPWDSVIGRTGTVVRLVVTPNRRDL